MELYCLESEQLDILEKAINEWRNKGYELFSLSCYNDYLKGKMHVAYMIKK
jgi:exo-beta-1,3-glucanase (GH17 family)